MFCHALSSGRADERSGQRHQVVFSFTFTFFSHPRPLLPRDGTTELEKRRSGTTDDDRMSGWLKKCSSRWQRRRQRQSWYCHWYWVRKCCCYCCRCSRLRQTGTGTGIIISSQAKLLRAAAAAASSRIFSRVRIAIEPIVVVASRAWHESL